MTPSTPRLVAVRKDIEANIAAMAAYAGVRRAALRPHAKTHKSPDIARLQIAAGAIGISCATVAEVEAMAASGLRGLLLTSPVAPDKAPRIAALHNNTADIMVVADNTRYLDALSAATAGTVHPLRVLVDMDVGHRRTGTPSPCESLALVEYIKGLPTLTFAGVQAYAGHAQHVIAAAARRQTAEDCAARLRDHLKALHDGGHRPAIVTGSGTGCFAADMEIGLYTEYQVGSYVVMDTEYGELEAGPGPRFAPALFLEATVIGRHYPDFVLIDAGHKALFRGGPLPVLAGPMAARLRYEFAGDEHGRLHGASADLPQVGERVQFLLPHCDPNIVLFDHIDVEDGGRITAQWPITARGVW